MRIPTRPGKRIPYTNSPRTLLQVRCSELRTGAVSDAAISGLGITVMSIENVLGAVREGSLVQVLPEYEVEGPNELGSTIIMQYPRKHLLSPNVRALIDFILEKLQGRNPLDVVSALGRSGPVAAVLAPRHL